MKNVFKTLLLVGSLTTFMFGCKGDDGTLGPTGANGTNGTNGTNGKDGNANVVYTDWKTMDWSGGFILYNGNKNAQLSIKSTAEPLFTQDAIDKGVLYTYYKINNPDQEAGTNEYKLVDVVGAAGYYFFKRPGISKNGYEDYTQAYISTIRIGVNYFQPNLNILTQTYDYTIGNYIADPQYANKTAADYRDYVKGLTYRHVIIYGSTKASRMSTPVDMNDYNAVKAFYKLPN